MMLAILSKDPSLYYFQGFHDFVSVFLLTLQEDQAFVCA